MANYDLAHQLAKQLKESPEYLAYRKAREAIEKDEKNKKMLKEYKKKEFAARMQIYAGKKDSEEVKEYQNMGLVLQYNKDITEYLMAEYRMNQVMSDIFKILGDAVDIDLSFMDEGAQ